MAALAWYVRQAECLRSCQKLLELAVMYHWPTSCSEVGGLVLDVAV